MRLGLTRETTDDKYYVLNTLNHCALKKNEKVQLITIFLYIYIKYY